MEVNKYDGLYDTWHAPNDQVITSCAIITTGPNELIAKIHHRSPVMIHPKDYETWPTTPEEKVDTVMALLVPYPADEMEMFEVSRLVNSPRNDSPENIVPVDAPKEGKKLVL